MAWLVGVPFHTPKVLGFGSVSGHVPRLQVWSLVGAHTGSNQLMFFSHTDVSVSLPSSLSKINEEIMSLGEGKMG